MAVCDARNGLFNLGDLSALNAPCVSGHRFRCPGQHKLSVPANHDIVAVPAGQLTTRLQPFRHSSLMIRMQRYAESVDHQPTALFSSQPFAHHLPRLHRTQVRQPIPALQP